MTEIIQPIPARLRNISNGGHVAGASDIFDDDQEKSQDGINAELYKVAAIISMIGLNGMSTATSVTNNYFKWVVTDNNDNIIMAVTKANRFEVYADLDDALSTLVDAYSNIINNA